MRCRGQTPLELLVVAAAAEVNDVEVAAELGIRAAGSRLGKGLDRGQVDRARALAAAHHQQAARLGGDPKATPRLGPVGTQDRGRHRPPGEQVRLALATLDREGEADTAGPSRQ